MSKTLVDYLSVRVIEHRIPGAVRWSGIAILCLIVLALLPFRPLRVQGRSMEPTLRHGDTYLLDHLYWKGSGLRRGDIVVLKRGKENWVKRLIGLPGDKLHIHHRRNSLVTYVGPAWWINEPRPPRFGYIEEVVVGPDEIYIVGDNLNHSADSTFQQLGEFHLKDVIGVLRSFKLSRDFPPVRRVSAAPQ